MEAMKVIVALAVGLLLIWLASLVLPFLALMVGLTLLGGLSLLSIALFPSLWPKDPEQQMMENQVIRLRSPISPSLRQPTSSGSRAQRTGIAPRQSESSSANHARTPER